MHGAPLPPVIRPPNAAADHQFVGAQLWSLVAIINSQVTVIEGSHQLLNSAQPTAQVSDPNLGPNRFCGDFGE